VIEQFSVRAENAIVLGEVSIGDTVTALVEVTNIDHANRRVFFSKVCTVKNKKVIIGNAELYVP